MIVKITYSSELEEVPSEVSKLLQDVEKQLTALAKKLPGKELAEQEPDIKSAISRLEHSMSGLEKLEAKVKDCHAILVGFLGVKEKKESAQSESNQATEKEAE
jgi:hypothetical protein